MGFSQGASAALFSSMARFQKMYGNPDLQFVGHISAYAQCNTRFRDEEDVKKPKEDFFGNGQSCRYAHFNMGGGRIDVQMTCNEEGATQTTNVSGTYTPTTYSIDMSSSGTGEHQGMTMKMHADAHRVGECTAKDD